MKPTPGWLVTVTAALCVCLSVTGWCPAEETPAPSLIAFSVRRWEGEYRSRDIPGGVETTPSTGSIWTIRGDGSGIKKVHELAKDTNAPEFSPDGKWLYFQSNATGDYRIYRSRVDGTERHVVISPQAVGPSWKSAYGLSFSTAGRLVFTVHDGQRGTVAVAEPDGAQPRLVAPNAGYLYMAALNPAGDTIVCSGPAADYRLQRIGLADGKPVVLTPDHPQSFVPRVTPDGKTVVFFRRDGDIYRVGMDGSGLRRLTTGVGHVEFRLSPEDRHGSSDPPDISPDGRRIAFVAEQGPGARIRVIDLDGTHERTVAERSTACGRVRWSPDGKEIAFVSFEGKYPQLFVVPAEGGTPRQLTRLEGAVYFVAWQPGGAANTELPPWKVNTPIVRVEKSLHTKHPKPRTAALVSMQYVGPGLERREVRGFETTSDVADEITARWSDDNGRTWSAPVAVQPSNIVKHSGVPVWEGEGSGVFDPASGRLVQLWLRQIERNGLYHCATYVRHSSDQGRTWSEPQPLRYEEGEPFNPAKPLDPSFLNRNQGYPGNNILNRSDGSLVVCLAHANAPGDPRNDRRPWRMGSILFLGRWDAAKKTYDWQPGARVEIAPDRSARGLMEPEVAELKDGRLLVVWRGSDQGWDGTVAREPGRKWFSLSADGGRSLTPVQEWKYDDGSRFYSPSSIHRMIWHSTTGKLYWLGNICPTPPNGNSPRYPLVIAEVDEQRAAPRRSTVTAIDDREEGQGDIQFSNFSLLEDRETHRLELLLTTYGQEPDPANWATADCYRYRLSLAERP
ncbi:MAG: exo-alpha-sialidase [Isosphaeraceae bacterium]